MITCPNCSFPNSATAIFCENCGHPLPRPAPAARPSPLNGVSFEGERRFVTILLADLSGFTQLTEKSDPETVRTLVNACFDRLVPLVEKNQGVVDQFVGDQVVALFGAPIAHENDPEQACLTALELMRALAQFNRERGSNLGLHIGINSGLVLAGGVGSRGRQQYSVMGDAMNTAARLEDKSEQGEILVGPETYHLTENLFDYLDRGELQLKGKAQPTRVYQLIGEKIGATRRRRAPDLNAALLGRDREFASLRRLTDELRHAAVAPGEGGLRVVTIIGEAGIGKTRLVEEWRLWVFETNQLEAKPVRFVQGQCLPYGAANAYHLIVDLARSLIGVAPATSRDETRTALQNALATIFEPGSDAYAQILPPLEQLLALAESDSVPDPLTEAAPLYSQYVSALQRVALRLAADRPTIVLCEDVHWADAPSVELLNRLMQNLIDAPFLFCLTARPEPDSAGWRLIEAASELPGAGAIKFHLAALSEHDSSELLAQLLARDELPLSLQRMILGQAEGNPLFIEELLRFLIDRGDLAMDDGHWTLTRELYELQVPNTLQGVLMARVDQLPEEARRALQIASVIGREFPIEVLERVMARMDKNTPSQQAAL